MTTVLFGSALGIGVSPAGTASPAYARYRASAACSTRSHARAGSWRSAYGNAWLFYLSSDSGRGRGSTGRRLVPVGRKAHFREKEKAVIRLPMFVLAVFLLPFATAAASGADLTVTVKEVHSSTGTVYLAV